MHAEGLTDAPSNSMHERVRKIRTTHRLAVVIVFVLGAGGCVRRDGRNFDCRWPGETSSNSPVTARHLGVDAEFAEDLAIRYADVHFGPRSPNLSENYQDERDRCMQTLFEAIAKEHGVAVERVSGSPGRNRAYIDVAEILPFALLYGFAAMMAAHMIWGHYTPEYGYATAIIMAVFVSLALATGGNMLGNNGTGLSKATALATTT